MIYFLDVSKYFGNHLIFDQVHCHIEMGSFNCLIGANGSGKSTFLKLILKQEIPNGGEILFFQRSLAVLQKSSLEEHRRQIGVIEQEHRFLRHENVETNLMLPFSIAGAHSPENNSKMLKLAEQLNLTRFLKSPVYELSSGERQLVSVARAMVHDPALILADDPTQFLSEESASTVITLLKEANNGGATVILTSRSMQRIPHGSGVWLIRRHEIQEFSGG
ncbi:MAG: ATP-binding cassette domain-containing protein [SAR324 cluster bacterium]|nr:ATP-binding cassette domain-containing protein [SAR324 cluster bacterium]